MSYNIHKSAISFAAGFSLIEVVLCLGIMSFAIVALLGLMPVGLQAFRQSIDVTTQAQIAQQITSEAQLADWSGPGNTYTNQPTYYYNDQGYRTTSSTSLTLYTVTIKLSQIDFRSIGIAASPPPSVATNLVVEIVNKAHPQSTNKVQVILFNPGKQS